MKKKTIVRICVMLAIFAVLFTLDLVTKYIFDAQLANGEVISVIPYIFNFKLVHNYGAAWGLMAGKQVFLIVLSFIFLGIFVFYYIKEPKKSWLFNVTFAFLFAGCLGNLFDRLVLGYVRDFIQFDFWKSFPIFNIADIALFFGVILFIVYLIVYYVGLKKNKVTKNESEKDAK